MGVSGSTPLEFGCTGRVGNTFFMVHIKTRPPACSDDPRPKPHLSQPAPYLPQPSPTCS